MSVHWSTLIVAFRRRVGVTLLSGCLLAPAAAEEITLAHEGRTLNAILQLADGTQLSEGAVIVIHGMLMHNRMEIVERTQALLGENGISSLAINLSYGLDDRHGQYDCMLPHRHTLEGSVREIVAWKDWLAARGARSVVLLGHSLSANLALVAAVEHDDDALKGTVLLAPNTSGYGRLVASYESRYGVELSQILREAKHLVEVGRADALMEVDFGICPRTRASAATFLDLYRANPIRNNMAGYLVRVGKPTLVVAASADERQPDVEAYVISEADGKRVRLHVVEDSGHFFLDLNLDDAMDAVVPFIKEVM